MRNLKILITSAALCIASIGLVTNTFAADDLSAQCAGLTATTSAGPAPLDLTVQCADLIKKQDGQPNVPVPAPDAAVPSSDNIVFGVEEVNHVLSRLALNDPNNLELLQPHNASNFVGGCDFNNTGFFEALFCIDSGNPADFFRLNTQDGTRTDLGQATPFGSETFSSLSTDPTSGIMYATSTNVGTSSLYTIDITSGQATRVGEITNSPAMVSSGFDNDGNFYGVDVINDSLISVDKATGAGTIVGPLGYDANFGQGMDFDERTGTCYLFAFNNGAFMAELRTCDTATGSTTSVGRIGPDPDLFQISGGGISRFTWPKFQPSFTGGARP